MKQRSRTRRVLKWAGAALCWLIVATLFLSGRYHLRADTRSEYIVDVQNGDVTVHWPRKGTPLRMYCPPVRALVGRLPPPYNVRSLLRSPRYFPRLDLTQPPGGFRTIRYDPLSDGALRIPCWTVFLVAAAPTALLWWRDRRYPAGHCQTCGYNLTGNVSGRCPECGTLVAELAPAASVPHP